ncbi:putative Zn finger-like uncharacterized protein [Variovorax boronicumulans]|uniref:Zn finger-like uncharacterized protein n=1 Tax=Variovorax boronicumulans TaxID=436515 RepID=A0AAW8DQW7_9BURK|nr:zinc-ribbon and DUF3426 domain-containing protein [Variovorax boronicumulans]MDP9877195.1 putative Zn finger-like uncharacterized protein [Variovorax boronicumulans]MDP9921928.1 putative Zn finger-like uncharacterized protein [Variovorax boronicumulans]
MSLVTRCPACTTTFKVVRDQLRISDGWVRCGRCSHVFDATLDLQEAPGGAVSAPAAPAPAPTPAASPMSSMAALVASFEDARIDLAAARPAVEEADFLDDESEPQAPPPAPQDEAGLSTAATNVAPAASPLPFELTLPAHGLAADEPWSDLDATEPAWRPPASSLPPFPNIDLNLGAPPPASPPPAPPLPDLPRSSALRGLVAATGENDDGAAAEREQEEKDHDQLLIQKALRRARAKSAKIANAKARDAQHEEAAAPLPGPGIRAEGEPDFSLSATFEAPEDHPFAEEDEPAEKAIGFWQRKGVRRLLVVLAVLAALALIVQIVRHERDGIVARQPNLRPALSALCQYAGCELAALRQIGDIVIEGAAFAREKSGGNDYRLSFTLRNAATVPLAMPAIELSLLDTQEQAVVRRVLTPADYGAPGVLAARADRAASLPLTLSASEAAALPPIAGYRVEAFYP